MGQSVTTGMGPSVESTVERSILVDRLARQESEIRSLCAEVLDRYEEATLVYRLSERIGAILGEGAIARMVLDEAAGVLGARCAEAWLRDEHGMCRVASLPAEEVPLDRGGDDDLLDRSIASGVAVTCEATAGDEPAAAVPLPGPGGAPLGVLVFRGRTGGRSYRSGELKLLGALASLASAFIRNDRLAESARQADARRREDEIARQVHRGLLPRLDPTFPGLSICGGFRAAESVGGDYYGYIPAIDGGLSITMADVSGHGVGAALYMATAKGAIQSEARGAGSPSDVLRRVNGALLSDFAIADMFATAVFVRFVPGGRRLAYANAGHPPPILLRADGPIELLDSAGPALGVLPDVRYPERNVAFRPGDLLLVFTDGLVEARDGTRRFYGVDRLVAVARSAMIEAPWTIHSKIFADLASHCDGSLPQDDVTLVVIGATEGPAAGFRVIGR